MSSARHFVVSINEQSLSVIENETCVQTYPVSTAIKGMGFAIGSFRTPTGAFRIVELIGADQPSGTIFKGRVPVGLWQRGDISNEDLILTRILRLDGLDPANANTLERCIYIHGTNHEEFIGQRAGHGCVRLRNHDMIELFNRVNVNDLVEIQPATQPCGSLLFVHLDHMLTPADRVRTTKWIDANREQGGILTATALKVSESILAAKAAGWMPVLVSNATADVAASISRLYEIDHYEALNPLENRDLVTIICDWRQSCLPLRAVMLGHHSMMPCVHAVVDVFISTDSLSYDENLIFDAASRVMKMDDVSSWSQLLHAG